MLAQIEALLPQTQCERCGFKGCTPYAQAMLDGDAPLNRCFPGGQKTADALANLLARPKILVEEAPPLQQVAVIRESDCIGCTKCIQACPVDAIVGASKLMHTIIESECTGCGLCLPPCPMLCIDLIALEPYRESGVIDEQSKAKAEHSQWRHDNHQNRLAADDAKKSKIHQEKANSAIQNEIMKSLERTSIKKPFYYDAENSF